MKYKHYLIILSVLFLLLFYNIFCYKFVNKYISNGTKDIVGGYFQEYEYLNATLNDDNSINVYIKVDDNYHRFKFIQDYGRFQLLEVNQDIPEHIKRTAF